MSYITTTQTLGIIKMDKNHVVGSINKPETPQRVRENKVDNITKTFPTPKMFPSLFSGTLECLKSIRIHLNRDPEVNSSD